jgi:hypothetical protein
MNTFCAIQLLTHLFHTATETLRDAFRTRLDLPDGRIGAIAAVHTFGDYLIFHPHLHVLAANGLFTPDGHFHCMPAEDLDPAIELFRHRFLHALREAKLISPGKLADLLTWKHSGFHIHDGGEKPVAAHDSAGRKRLAEYLLRHPFSLQKITWNATTQTVIYHSKRHHTTKRNMLVDNFGDPVSFDQPQLLCGKCHGDKLRDWRDGIHGKRIGEFTTAGKKRWFTCTECHNPHNVQDGHRNKGFVQLQPEPPPQTPNGMKDMKHELVHGVPH